MSVYVCHQDKLAVRWVNKLVNCCSKLRSSSQSTILSSTATTTTTATNTTSTVSQITSSKTSSLTPPINATATTAVAPVTQQLTMKTTLTTEPTTALKTRRKRRPRRQEANHSTIDTVIASSGGSGGSGDSAPPSPIYDEVYRCSNDLAMLKLPRQGPRPKLELPQFAQQLPQGCNSRKTPSPSREAPGAAPPQQEHVQPVVVKKHFTTFTKKNSVRSLY